MSRHTWKSAASEAAEGGRDVISFYLLMEANEIIENSDLPDLPDQRDMQDLAEAVRNAIHPLDSRCLAAMGKGNAAIRRDNDFAVTRSSEDGIRLASAGTADLFGITPGTHAVQRLFELLLDAGRGVDRLRNALRGLPAPAVHAFGKLLDTMMKLRSAVTIEHAAPTGIESMAELGIERLQAACAYLEERQVSSVFVQVRGKLQALNPARRTFRLEGEDGRVYEGGITPDIRKRYGKDTQVPALPVIAEALIEKRSIYQPSLEAESTVELLAELDTDPGENRDELLPKFQRLYDRLNAALAHEDEYEQSAPVTAADYAELSELSDRLLASNPHKGARRALDPADLTDMHALLTEGRPIGTLALSGGGGFDEADDYDADGYDSSPSARAAKQKAAAERNKLAAAAFGDSVKLAGRLLRMIDALQDDAP